MEGERQKKPPWRRQRLTGDPPLTGSTWLAFFCLSFSHQEALPCPLKAGLLQRSEKP